MLDSHQVPARRMGLFTLQQKATTAQGRAGSSVSCLATMTESEAGCHLRSGRAALWATEAALSHPAKVDAIIVPTVRALSYLNDAATVAARLDCPLVTLHSGKWTQAEEAARRLSKVVELIAIDVTDPRNLRLPDTMTSRLLKGTLFARRTDTSHKRNLGLVLSHMMRWNRVVFLDDDICVPNPDDLLHAAGLLDTYNVVGLSLGGFPDNSVVCHAYRMVGGTHQSLIGGGALAVDVSRCSSFFPNIYNEDWFYLLDEEGETQPVAVTGLAVQRPYDPFGRVDRARFEELGDVLAGGIFWLHERGLSWADADQRHWAEFLMRRKFFIDHVKDTIEQKVMDPERKARMIEAMTAARGRLACISPDICHHYLNAWMADRVTWQRHIKRLPYRNRSSALRSLSAKGKSPLKYYSAESLAVGHLSQPVPDRPSHHLSIVAPAIAPNWHRMLRRSANQQQSPPRPRSADDGPA